MAGISLRRTFSLVCTSLVLAAAPLIAFAQNRPDNAILVTAETVQVSAPVSNVQSIGTGKAIRSIIVTADVAGTVAEIHAQPNAEVAANDPIVTLVRKTQEILLDSANAEFDKQKAAFGRLESLLEQNSSAVSQSQVDEARAALAVAQANVAEAQYEYDRRVIRAPFAGRINLNDLSVGSYLPQGAVIVNLIDSSRLLVEFTVPETAVSRLQTGIPVRLLTPALRGRVFHGTVTAYDSAVDAEFRTVRVRAEVQNPQAVLLPGMTFSVSIDSPEPALPAIPAVSILWSQEGAFVWKLGPDNSVQPVDVTLRHRTGDTVWVEADLAEGDQVVRDGAFKLSADAQVTVEGDGADG